MDACSSQFAWQFPGLLLILVAALPVVMATAGGHLHLVDLPATPPSAGTKGSGGVSSSDATTSDVVLLVFSFLVTLCLACYISHRCRRHEEEQAAVRDNNGRGQRSSRGDAPRPRPQQQQRPTVAAAPPPAGDVELAQAPAPAPVLDCTFRKAEGWVKTTCSVCLSKMADGEAVSVLTACMHRFHTACVQQWLRDHGTCPLCRAPAAGAAAKARRHWPTI